MDTKFPVGMLAQKSAISVAVTQSNSDLVPLGIPLINAGGIPKRFIPTRIDCQVTPATSQYLPGLSYGTFATMGAAVFQVWTATGGTGTRLDSGTNTMSNLNSATGYQTFTVATLTAYPTTATNVFLYCTTGTANAGYVDFFMSGHELTNYN